MTEVWTGSFCSDNVIGVRGNLYTTLHPFTKWDYLTKIEIDFVGFASIIQNIFHPNMILDVLISNDQKFNINCYGVDITFVLDDKISPGDTFLKGKYIAKKNNYYSHGRLYLQKGDENYENENCSIM